jgi:hypothetical protein
MCFVIYTRGSACSYRVDGRVLARQAGLSTISFQAVAKQRGILNFYGDLK